MITRYTAFQTFISRLHLSPIYVTVLYKILIILSFLSLASGHLKSQCQIYDGQGNASNAPVWVSCTGGAFTLFLQSPSSFGAISIDWGDGNTTNAASLIPPAFISHVYAAGIANYTVTVTTGACTIVGLVVMEEPVNASIQIPIGGVTQTCAPDDLIFSNSSTDVSSNTTFIWDFGDGTPTQTFGPGNAGQTITHTYAQGTVTCVTQVTLSAQNYCSFGNPTLATFNPIQIYDLDVAAITASNTLLCYPDTVVHFTNTTAKNCVPQGNTAQRFEYWNFGDYWGVGSDSIVDWVPFDPPAKPGHDIAYPGIGTYTVMMADSNMCGRDTAFITIQIVDAPQAGVSSSTDSSCAGDPVTFTNLSAGGTNSTINFGDGGGAVAFGATATHTYNTAGNFTVTVMTTIAGGTASCTDIVTLSIEILPSPSAVASISPNTGCDSVTAVFVNSSSGGVAYDWDFGGGQTSTLQNPPPLTYSTPGQYPVTLMVTSNNGCTASTTTNVYVYDTPIPAISATNVCEDNLASFSDASTVGYGGPVNAWQWNFGDAGNSTSTAENPTFTYVDSGTYVVTLIASTTYCTDTIQDTITVEPNPFSLFAESDSIGCSPLNVSFTNQSQLAVTYLWNFGDGATSTAAAPSHTFVHSSLTDTFYIVTLYAFSAFGCEDSITDTIFVQGNPIADFTSDAVLDCAPLVVNFTDQSTGAISWTWDFGDTTGSTLQDPTHTFQNQTLFITNYTTTLITTAPNGCADTAIETITVYPEPLFNFNMVPDSGCSPLTVQFPVAVGAVIYNWDFGDGNTSTGPNPSHTFLNTTTNNAPFTVTLIAITPFGCVDTVQGTVTVFPKPDAQLSPSISQGCEPLAVTFVNGSTGGTTYSWDLDDGNTSASGNTTLTHNYPNNTNDTLFYFPTIIAATPEGCSDTAGVEVRVFRKVVADFSVPQSGCHPFTTAFTDQSQNPNSWAWNFGDGGTSTAQNPTHQYLNNGSSTLNFTASLTVQTIEGCQDAITKNISVYHKPNAQILPTNLAGCQPLIVNFANNSTAASSFQWYFGDGDSSTVSTGITHTYPNPSNATIVRTAQLIAISNQGCRDTAEAEIQIYRKILASFSVPTEHCHPYDAQFSDMSTNAVSWNWDFDDGFTSGTANPQHTFQNTTLTPMQFNVQLTVQNVNNCSHDTAITVTVNPKPTSSFSLQSSPACSGEPVSIVNTSVLNDINYWKFGSNSLPVLINQSPIDTVIENTNDQNRNIFIELAVENTYGCQDTSYQTLVIFPRLKAEFVSPTEGCSPFNVSFINSSYGGQLFTWDFGDGNSSFLNNPSNLFENNTTADVIYTVILKVTSPNNCEAFDSLDILVHPTPAPQFTVNPIVQVFPDTIVLINNLTPVGPWVYDWQFDDSQTSNLEQPISHSYSTWGTYEILLHASTEYCWDTASRTIVIEPPLPIADFELEIDDCAPVAIQFENKSLYGVYFLWEFGDGATSSAIDPYYVYQYPGTYTVKLTVTGPGGDVDTKTILNAVTVRPEPIANFIFSPSQVNVPTDVLSLINYSQNSDSYFWDFGDGTTSEEASPQKVYSEPGEYFITLISITNFGCSDTFTSSLPVIGIAKGVIQVPNAFTPNTESADGAVFDPYSVNNSVFFPVLSGVGASNYTLSIFNRWGELLFETNDIRQGWNGWYRDKPCQQDAYVWRIRGEYITGERFTKVGDVTLIK